MAKPGDLSVDYRISVSPNDDSFLFMQISSMSNLLIS